MSLSLADMLEAMAEAGASPEMMAAAARRAQDREDARTAEKREKAAARKRRQRAREAGDEDDGHSLSHDVTVTERDSADLSPRPPIGSLSQKKNPPKGGQKERPIVSNADCEAVWNAWPTVGRRRSSRKKADAALRRAAKAHSLETIRSGMAAYLRSYDATKDDGAFVPALDRWLRDEKYLEWSKPADDKPKADPASLDPRAQRILCRNFAEAGTWDARHGPQPDSADCKLDPEILAEFGFDPLPRPALRVVGGEG